MKTDRDRQLGFAAAGTIFLVGAITLALTLVFLGRPLRRLVREALMQRVTSAHYEILCPPGAMSQEAMTTFATQRESLFTELDRKLGDADSNAEIQIIFNTDAPPVGTASTEQPYAVSGTTIRTKLDGRTPTLDSAADAEALLQRAWGKRGNFRIGQWTAVWLVGQYDGKELGVAAAEVEQRLGIQQLATFVNASSNKDYSPDDRLILGAAWISEIAESSGTPEVRKLYTTRMSTVSLAAATNALGMTPHDLESKWQTWMNLYMGKSPVASRDSRRKMELSMPRNN